MEITLKLNIFNTYTVQKFSDLYACQPKKRDVKNKKNLVKIPRNFRQECVTVVTK